VGVLVRIALRNLLEHKGKTLIIGSIVALGVVVLVVGNAMMDTARTGIERAFISNYTGDIMISGMAEGNISLFGVQSVGGIEQTPVIPDFNQIAQYLESNPQISVTTTQISGFGFLRAEDDRIEGLENSAFTVLFGTDPSSYHEMFDNLQLTEGSYLSPGEEGIMLSADRIEELQEAAIRGLEDAGLSDELGEEPVYEIHVGDDIRVVSGLSQGLPRIRVVPLVGIYEMTGISEGVGAELVSYVDAQTLRALLGLSLGASNEITLDYEQTELLDRVEAGLSDSPEDEFFSSDPFSDDFFGESVIADASEDLVDFENLDALLGNEETQEPTGEETDPATAATADAGTTWHYFLARVENPRRTDRVVAELNEWFISQGISAQAGNWEVAAGPFATTADVIRTVFNIAILIIGIVAVIIIMNTMVLSVMERTSEIGTMRALGAQRGFVWRMFMAETLVITSLFGLIGVATGLGVIGILHLIGIPATNTFLTILYAGPELKPVASLVSVIGSLLIVSTVGILAHLYPVSVALKIQPIKAIQTE
jgi:ABC-type lipoprotein release transport system permease subunit